MFSNVTKRDMFKYKTWPHPPPMVAYLPRRNIMVLQRL